MFERLMQMLSPRDKLALYPDDLNEVLAYYKRVQRSSPFEEIDSHAKRPRTAALILDYDRHFKHYGPVKMDVWITPRWKFINGVVQKQG